MGETEMLTVIEFIDQRIFIIIPVLWAIGLFLKSTPRIPDWTIVWILSSVGIAMSILTIGLDVNGVIQGFLATAVAVLGYDVFHQTRKAKK